MKYLLRICSAAVAGLSLLLWLATVTLWVRSYWVYDEMWATFGEEFFALDSCKGRLDLLWDTHYRMPSGPYGWERHNLAENPAVESSAIIDSRVLGFGWYIPGDTFNGTTFRVIAFPDWGPALLTLWPPALWAWRRARVRRVAGEGCCTHCGYDLRASGERCPECGTPVPAARHPPPVRGANP